MKMNTGFTLIELIVVIVIFMTLVSFVSPLGIKQVEKAQAQHDLLKVIQIIREASTFAYASGDSVELKLQGNQVRITTNNGTELVTFTKIHFPNQNFKFNRSGLLSNSQLAYQIGDLNYSMNVIDKLIPKQGVYTYAP